MTNRKKVIKGLEHCIADNCDLCPYDENVDCPGFDPTPKTLLADVLAMLKAQEPVGPNLLVMNGRLSNGTKYICGGCGGSFFHQKVNFCPWCGRAVKWE